MELKDPANWTADKSAFCVVTLAWKTENFYLTMVIQ
jgi:hypothetical protein